SRVSAWLLVSGGLGESRETSIGWVLSKFDCEAELGGPADVFELERGGASFLVRRDRFRRELEAGAEPVAEVGAQLSLFDELPVGPPVRGWQLPELVPVPAPPLHKVRQLSYSALALFLRCSYRFYAERGGGLRE